MCQPSHPPRLVTHNIGEFVNFSKFQDFILLHSLYILMDGDFYIAPYEQIQRLAKPIKEQTCILSLDGNFCIVPWPNTVYQRLDLGCERG